MSLRISSAALLLLAGCGAPQDGTAPANVAAASPIDLSPVDPPRLDCAIGGGGFANACTFEREDVAGGAILTVRHRDGGFRRLRIARDGAVTAADGAVPAEVLTDRSGATIVAIDGDRYRLPAGSVPSPAR